VFFLCILFEHKDLIANFNKINKQDVQSFYVYKNAQNSYSDRLLSFQVMK